MLSDILRRTKRDLYKTLDHLDASIKESYNKPRILYIAPHLSTGGMPQYLYKKIDIFYEQAEIFCIQYNNTAEIYNVQRNLIRDKLGNRFWCLGENKAEILQLIDDICPDIIHFDDFPEFFIKKNIIDSIYSLARPYLIFETCHSSSISIDSKIYKPDKFIMVNEWMVDKFAPLGIPLDILEYPIENFIRPDRAESLTALGLDPNKKHIINVGLFAPGKNQKELIEYAKELISLPIEFHFIGNMAPNFIEYWKPLLADLPVNCSLWGELADVDSFYKSADLFVFNSIWELNPITIKEALSWNLPILMRRLPSYKDSYDNMELVNFMRDKEYNIETIKKILDII